MIESLRKNSGLGYNKAITEVIKLISELLKEFEGKEVDYLTAYDTLFQRMKGLKNEN